MDSEGDGIISSQKAKEWNNDRLSIFKIVANDSKASFSHSNATDKYESQDLPSPSNETIIVENALIESNVGMHLPTPVASVSPLARVTPPSSPPPSSPPPILADALQRPLPTPPQSPVVTTEANVGEHTSTTAPNDYNFPLAPMSPIVAQGSRFDHLLTDIADIHVKDQDGGEEQRLHVGDCDPMSMRTPSFLHPRVELSTEEEVYEKQTVLLELEQLQKKNNIRVSKVYTMNDNLADMQFEVRRQLTEIEEENTVKFMKDALKLSCTGIEMLNTKMGPFLELSGWSNEVCNDMDRYNGALGKLYKKYWRRSSMSPEMELMMGLVGSLGMHHFKAKFLGAPSSGSRENTANTTRNPPPPMRRDPPGTGATREPNANINRESIPPPPINNRPLIKRPPTIVFPQSTTPIPTSIL